MIRRALVSISVIGLAGASCIDAQQQTLNSEQRGAVIDSIASYLNSMYVFPDVATRMDTDMHARARRLESRRGRHRRRTGRA